MPKLADVAQPVVAGDGPTGPSYGQFVPSASSTAPRYGFHGSFVPHLIALVGAAVVALIPDPTTALRALALLSCGYGIGFVARRGRAFLTPSGVLYLASGVFIGLAAFYLADIGSVNEMAQLRDWAVVAFVVTVASAIVLTAFSIRWGLSWSSLAAQNERNKGRVPYAPRGFALKALVLVGLSQVPPVRGIAGPLATGAGLAGVMMLVFVASARRVKMRWFGDILVAAMAIVVPFIWIKLEFEGGGRLTIAGLGVASLLAWNLVRPRRLQKIVVVLAIPVFLIYAGANRLEKDQRDTSSSVLSSGDGLESMYGPLDTWAELATVDATRQRDIGAPAVGPRYGKTFLNTLYLPIPRGLWETKPKGFGAQLTEILRPVLLRENRIAENHSMAALLHGEWYVNFGLVGLGILPLALGWFMAVLDRAHARLAAGGLVDSDDWWRAAILACLVGSLGDLFWVGSFTFVARGGLAALVAWAVWRLAPDGRRTLRREPRHVDQSGGAVVRL